MKVAPYLRLLAEKDGSDVYLSTGAAPSAKFNGVLKPIGKDPCPQGYVKSLANEIMNEKQLEDFSHKPEMNLALSLPGIGRFRVNIFKQRGEVAMVIRNIQNDIPDIDSLGLPEILKKIMMVKNGLILVVGLCAIGVLEVRQYPQTQDTVVTVSTSYPGASSELVKGFITTPLQQAIAEAQGIDYLSSTSTQGQSVIEAHMRLNYSPNAAVAEIQAKVASRRNVLPADADDPVISSRTGDATALMYLAFYSEQMHASQINDYLLASGKDIQAMNAWRKRFSRIKGGGLLRYVQRLQCTQLIQIFLDLPDTELL